MALSRKYAAILAVLALSAILLMIVVYSPVASYAGPPSDHFDGNCFFNDEPEHTFSDMIKWLWEMKTVDWPKWVEDPPQPAPAAFVGGKEIKITYVNHATMLIQTDSVNILTDPIWSERASPVSWIGTKRVRAPGIRMEDLPKIDAILISHDHYDHLDLPTVRRLCQEYRPQILVGLGLKGLLTSEGISNVVEMDWWEEQALRSGELKITFVPALHTSGRFPLGGDRTLWGGFVIEGPGGRIYYAGDTGYGRFLLSIRERFPSFRLTIFPVGNYEKRWFMKSQHMNPDDAVMAHRLLNSGQSVGMHFGTFLEHPEQTINAHEKDLRTALEKYNLPESDFWILGFGEGRFVSD